MDEADIREGDGNPPDAGAVGVYGLDDVFDFGKHKKKTIRFVIEKDQRYMRHCFDFMPDFKISEAANAYLNKKAKSWKYFQSESDYELHVKSVMQPELKMTTVDEWFNESSTPVSRYEKIKKERPDSIKPYDQYILNKMLGLVDEKESYAFHVSKIRSGMIETRTFTFEMSTPPWPIILR